MRCDSLIIKLQSDYVVQKNIGRIFRTYNIIEYKSPDDYISINDFYKVYAYACKYLADTPEIGSVNPTELTITFVASHFPRKMLHEIEQVRKIHTIRREPGIYDLAGDPIPMQLIVLPELTKEKNYWLKSLRKNIFNVDEIQDLIARYEEHKDNILYASAMNVIAHANYDRFQEVKHMCEALRMLFADELEEGIRSASEKAVQEGLQQGIQQGLQQGIQQGLQQGIQQGMQQGLQQGMQQGMQKGLQAFIYSCRDLHITREETLNKINLYFSVTPEQAIDSLNTYWA